MVLTCHSFITAEATHGRATQGPYADVYAAQLKRGAAVHAVIFEDKSLQP